STNSRTGVGSLPDTTRQQIHFSALYVSYLPNYGYPLSTEPRANPEQMAPSATTYFLKIQDIRAFEVIQGERKML
ncbi:hypothetical protein, partial [Insolitispirillum peregrinum]